VTAGWCSATAPCWLGGWAKECWAAPRCDDVV
jgi:hypothetical protein